MTNKNSRRRFIKNGMLAGAGFYIIPRHVMGRGFVAPSDKTKHSQYWCGR